jgi:hypothetical protein
MVIAPIFWFMPSPEIKRQMVMRDRAMQLGLQVKICDLPQTRRARVRKEYLEKGVVYRLLWKKPLQPRDQFCELLLKSGDSENPVSAAVEELLTGSLAAMPEAVLALEYATSGVAVYWRERGGIGEVENISDCLERLQKEILAVREHLSKAISE